MGLRLIQRAALSPGVTEVPPLAQLDLPHTHLAAEHVMKTVAEKIPFSVFMYFLLQMALQGDYIVNLFS